MIDLTYNRAKGVNLETKEFQDRVTVVRADGRKQSWVSSCKIQYINNNASLLSNESFLGRRRLDFSPVRGIPGRL